MHDITHSDRAATPRYRILLAEDDADLRAALGDALAAAGHTVVYAADGADGLRKMSACRPDVVVLDLMMPGLDGWQFRVAQRSDPTLAATPVVVISASDSATAAAVDADLYLKKPLDAKTLLRGIDAVIKANARRLEPARAAQAERLAALGTLAAGLAHEINNPLTYVLLQLAQALRLLPGLAIDGSRRGLEQVEALMRSSLEGAERIRGITMGIRAFSRSDDIALKRVDVRVPMDAALQLVGNEIRHRARLVTNYTEPPLVMANEGRLGQVLLNLITNAVQAIPDGDAVNHEIRVTAGADAEGDLLVEISDTGSGVAPHLLARIFDPYFSTKPHGEGSGLGLSISHHIITSLDGTLSVTSEAGHGATFRIQLPAARPQRPTC